MTVCSMTRSKWPNFRLSRARDLDLGQGGQGHEPLKVGNSAIFYDGGWQMTTDS